MKEPNQSAYDKWMTNYAPAYKEKFKKFFFVPELYVGTKKEKSHGVDKFINSIGFIVAYDGEDEVFLPSMFSDSRLPSTIKYDNLLGVDGKIDIAKVNSFMDNLYNMLDSFSKSSRQSATKFYEQAFPNTGKDLNGVYFVMTHLMEESNLSNFSLLISRDILKNYGENDKGLDILHKVRQYEAEGIKFRQEYAPKETENVPSNDIEKLFAGSSSELGKGGNNKSMQ